MSRWLSRSQGSSQNAITKKMVLLGNGGTKMIKHVIAQGKSIINDNGSMNVEKLKVRLRLNRQIEETIARCNGKISEFIEKWTDVNTNDDYE